MRVPNRDMPHVQETYGIEGGFWAQEKGFELMAHCTKRIPGGVSGQPPEFSRQHMYYQVFQNAPDRGAAFKAADTLRKLEKLVKRYDRPSGEMRIDG